MLFIYLSPEVAKNIPGGFFHILSIIRPSFPGIWYILYKLLLTAESTTESSFPQRQEPNSRVT